MDWKKWIPCGVLVLIGLAVWQFIVGPRWQEKTKTIERLTTEKDTAIKERDFYRTENVSLTKQVSEVKTERKNIVTKLYGKNGELLKTIEDLSNTDTNTDTKTDEEKKTVETLKEKDSEIKTLTEKLKEKTVEKRSGFAIGGGVAFLGLTFPPKLEVSVSNELITIPLLDIPVRAQVSYIP